MLHYHPVFIEEKFALKNYIVRNERLFEFERGQGIFVFVYLRHNDYPLVKYCYNDMNYSDVVMRFGENLELCIFIQKQLTPDNAGYMRNNFTFVDRLDGYDYLNSVLINHIFDKTFAGFMNVVQKGDCYFDISEKMMQVMESVDTLYVQLKQIGAPVLIRKPVFIRKLLDSLNGDYDGYLNKTKEKQMQYVTSLYHLMSFLPNDD